MDNLSSNSDFNIGVDDNWTDVISDLKNLQAIEKIAEKNKSEIEETQKFNNYVSRHILTNSVKREFRHEISEYHVNKYVLNLITDMGFIIQDRGLGDE